MPPSHGRGPGLLRDKYTPASSTVAIENRIAEEQRRGDVVQARSSP